MDSETFRVMSLHALIYCPRLFYLEEVEGIRLADPSVFAGRTLHEELRQSEEEDGEWTSVEYTSYKIGIRGKCDAIRKRNGSIIPYEHKRGRSHQIGKEKKAWDSDFIQVCAYGLLLEELFKKNIEECRIRYHQDNCTVKIKLDEDARKRVFESIEYAKILSNSVSRPPITENDKLCLKCSLAPVCLPEEERFLQDNEWKPVRLFPPLKERKTLHVVDHGSTVSKTGECLQVVKSDGKKEKFPITEIGSVCLHGYSQITTQAIQLCSFENIPVHWFTKGGYFTGTLLNSASPVQRRIRQYDAFAEFNFRMEMSKRLVTSKVENSLRYVLRFTRKNTEIRSLCEPEIRNIRDMLSRISKVETPDSLRGIEGNSARSYFKCISYILKGNNSNFDFDGRNRRPPKDPLNALLSYGYSLLHYSVMEAVLACGLEPAFGFFHTPRSTAHPLVLDIIELFRMPVWDITVLGSINRNMWDLKNDFIRVSSGGIWLSPTGKRKAISLYESRMMETWKHPVVNYSLSYSRIIELEVRLLEKEWSGSPGLFGKFRFR